MLMIHEYPSIYHEPAGPKDHSLTRFMSEFGGFGCDNCKASQPKGSTLFGCRTCDFDLCLECHEKERGTAPGSTNYRRAYDFIESWAPYLADTAELPAF